MDATREIAESGEIQTASFSYVIASDGANSKLRDLLGIEMEGPDALANYLMIHFQSDLRAVTAGKRGLLYFLFEPGVSGALIAYDQAKTWVLMHDWNPELENREDYTDEKCLGLIEQAVGQPLPETTIENVSPWVMTAQVANAYRKGRIFLAGDSAHRIPPAGGLGLNTGVGDVQNLTWKLAAVMKGAGDALLDSYEIERQPIARINNEQSLNNAMKMFDLIVAIHGLDPEKTAERYASVAESRRRFRSWLKLLRRKSLTLIVSICKLATATTVRQLLIQLPFLTCQTSLIISLLGCRCSFSAPLGDTWGVVQPLQSLLSPSTFTLLHGPDSGALAGHTQINQLTFGVDFQDEDSWQNQTGLPDNGAILIRPDGHIAARFDQVDEGSFMATVNQVLARG